MINLLKVDSACRFRYGDPRTGNGNLVTEKPKEKRRGKRAVFGTLQITHFPALPEKD